MRKLQTDWEAYRLSPEPLKETMDGNNTKVTNINDTLNTHIGELDKIRKRTQYVYGKYRVPVIIDLDDAVTVMDVH